MRAHIGGVTEVRTAGSTVRELLHGLQESHPALNSYLYDESGTLRPIVSVYVNDVHSRLVQGLDTPLRDGDEVYITPLVMGG